MAEPVIFPGTGDAQLAELTASWNREATEEEQKTKTAFMHRFVDTRRKLQITMERLQKLAWVGSPAEMRQLAKVTKRFADTLESLNQMEDEAEKLIEKRFDYKLDEGE